MSKWKLIEDKCGLNSYDYVLGYNKYTNNVYVVYYLHLKDLFFHKDDSEAIITHWRPMVKLPKK